MARKDIQEKTLIRGNIDGLHCASCVAFASKEIEACEGVVGVNISLLHKSLEIEIEPNADVSAVKNEVENRINDTGYSIVWINNMSEGNCDAEIWLTGSVSGLHCAACVSFVEKTIKKIENVQEVIVSLLHKKVSVKVNGVSNIGEIKRIIKESVHEAGYSLEWDELGSSSVNSFNTLKNVSVDVGGKNLFLRKMVIAIVISIVLMGFHLAHGVGLSVLSLKTINIISLILASISYWYCAKEYHQRALKMLRLKTTNMDTLISLSTTIAYFFSLYIILKQLFFSDSYIHIHHYLDAVGMIVAFVLIGRVLEENAKSKTTKAYQDLLTHIPSTSLVKRGDGFVEIPVDDIQVGDIVRIRKGENIAVDGLVVKGSASIDESSITGESIPAFKTEGDNVYAGTPVITGTIDFEADRLGTKTVFGKILVAVKNAQSMQAPIQRIADRVASVFVPIILLIALVTFLCWSFIPSLGSVSRGLFFAISVLAIACPCAMGLATPTAITVSIGRAAKEHILVSNVVAMENLANVTDAILDKTGTLTYGNPEVVNVLWLKENDDFKRFIIEAEKRSTHPLANSLVCYLSKSIENRGEISYDVVIKNFNEIIGKGVAFEDKQGIEYKVGSYAFIKEFLNDKNLLDDFIRFSNDHSADSIVAVSRNGILIAMFAIRDKAKEDAYEFISELKSMDIQPHLMSGDREASVAFLAKEMGINEFKSSQTPDSKLSYIEELKSISPNRTVMMLGDGVNDSPAMVEADVSIAMATGSDITKEVSDITVIGSNLKPVATAIKLSKKTKKIIYQNLFWAFAYNFVTVPLAAGVYYPKLYISPLWAAGFMALSSLIVVSNSLRLKWISLS